MCAAWRKGGGGDDTSASNGVFQTFSSHCVTVFHCAQGKFSNPVPFIVGSNENEGTLFNPLPFSITADDMVAAFTARFGQQAVQTVLPLYPVRL